MARKFLYFIAIVVVLLLAGAVLLRYWASDLTRIALVPRSAFVPQRPLAANVYDDPKMWISRPDQRAGNPPRWLPNGFTAQGPALPAAVFFVHPTSYLSNAHWNAPLDDADSRERAELFVRGMASAFNQSQQIWAPRYRQAAFGAFLTGKPEAKQAIDAAHADVLKAFDAFLANIGPNTPVVLAGHSQGSLHLLRLLKERVAGKPLARRIAAVYLIGWPVSLQHDLPETGLPACATPSQSGCVVSWLSYAEPADPGDTLGAYARSPGLDGQPRRGSAFLCTNPLTGTIGAAAPASANLGTLVPDAQLREGVVVKGMVPARCRPDGFLSIGPPPEMGPYVLPGNNYHVYDIPLFWANLRADVARRVGTWQASR